jgi:hypothetical protein
MCDVERCSAPQPIEESPAAPHVLERFGGACTFAGPDRVQRNVHRQRLEEICPFARYVQAVSAPSQFPDKTPGDGSVTVRQMVG